MGPAMSDHEESIRLADAAVRRLHDLFDVMRAIAAARRLVDESIREYEKVMLAIASQGFDVKLFGMNLLQDCQHLAGNLPTLLACL
jgi:hypothetical protein